MNPETYVSHMMNNPYPQAITELEADLGFHLLKIPSISDSNLFEPRIDSAVAWILSSSDILIKTSFLGWDLYSHRRYGYRAGRRRHEKQWIPVNNPVGNPELFVHDYNLGLSPQSKISEPP